MEILKELERELPNNELLGRRLFMQLVSRFPDIALDEQKDHEEVNWSCYTVKIPHSRLGILNSPDSITLQITDADDHGISMLIKLEDQDYNNSTLPLDSKQVLDNLTESMNNE